MSHIHAIIETVLPTMAILGPSHRHASSAPNWDIQLVTVGSVTVRNADNVVRMDIYKQKLCHAYTC